MRRSSKRFALPSWNPFVAERATFCPIKRRVWWSPWGPDTFEPPLIASVPSATQLTVDRSTMHSNLTLPILGAYATMLDRPPFGARVLRTASCEVAP